MDLDKKHRHIKNGYFKLKIGAYIFLYTHTEWPIDIEHLKQQNNIEKNRIEQYRKI